MKVATKLALALGVGIVLIHAIGATIWIGRESHQLREDVAADERQLGTSLSQSVSRIWRTAGEAEALALVAGANDRHRLEVRWVWLDAPAGSPHAAAAPPSELAGVARGEIASVEVTEDRHALYTYVPTAVPGDRIGAIELSQPLDEVTGYVRESIAIAVITACLMLLCSGVLAWFLGKVMIGRPAATLLDYARTVGSGDLTRRLEPSSRDEFGELTKALSRMCDDLQQARDKAEAEHRARLDTVEQLRHADRLATVGTLAAGVAHELGTPINVIEGHAQLLREHADATAATAQDTAVITRQCKRMTAIIQDLLRFARRDRPRSGAVDVVEMARETGRMCAVIARKRAVKIAIESEGEGFVAAIGADPIQQILTNVVMNGIQAMPEGGDVAVQIARERTTAPHRHVEGEYVRIRVKDTGIGMDDETKRRLFEPFFTTKEVGEGTGLGLSVALGIVMDHDGWIDVASEPRRGSQVSIYLPARTADAAA